MSDELTEQFIYPTNPLLKKAYQGVIAAVLKHQKVRFFAPALGLEILEYMGWPDDSGLNIIDNSSGVGKPSGPMYKRSMNLLRALEGKFTKFVGTGMVLEIFIFKPDGCRVSSFKDLELLCSSDVFMSEFVATNIKLDLSQEWKDEHIKKPVFSISQELGNIDCEIATKKVEILEVSVSKRKSRNKGVVKGYALKSTAYNIPSEPDLLFLKSTDVKTPLDERYLE